MWLGCRNSIYDRERSQLQLFRVLLLLWHSRKGLEIVKRSWHGDGFFGDKGMTRSRQGYGFISVYNVIVVTQLQAFIKTHWRSWILFSINCISGKHVVLVSISVTLINITTKSNLESKGFISAHNSQTMILYWRKSEQEGRNLEAGSETEPMKKCCFLACSPWFSLVSYPIQNNLFGGGVAPPTVNWAFSHPIISEENALQSCLWANFMEAFFFNWGSLSDDSSL